MNYVVDIHDNESFNNCISTQHNERFRGNQDHSTALRECTNLREQSCVESYLEQECLLEGLPIIESPDGDTIDVNEQNVSFVYGSRVVCAYIGVLQS